MPRDHSPGLVHPDLWLSGCPLKSQFHGYISVRFPLSPLKPVCNELMADGWRTGKGHGIKVLVFLVAIRKHADA